jgi:hypothetical protein
MSQDAIGAIPRQRYYNNQILYAADFQREQAFGLGLRELQTSLFFTPGILSGVGVANGAPGQVQVSPGAAVDDAGQVILLVDAATLAQAPVPVQNGVFVIDLSPTQYQGSTWLLTVQFNEVQDPNDASQFQQVPVLALSPDGSAPAAGQVPLARLTVTAAPPPPPPAKGQPTPPPQPPTVTVDTSVAAGVTLQSARVPALNAAAIGSGTFAPALIPPLDASVIDSGTLAIGRIPTLDAAAIGSGTFAPALIPPLDASVIDSGTLAIGRIPPLDAAAIGSGTFAPALIPPLDASVIDSGTLAIGRIPTLDAAAIGSGTFAPALIPPLDASAIATGTLGLDRIPDIPADKVIGGGPAGGVPTVWARGVAVYPQGPGLGSRAQSQGAAGGFVVGLLRTDTDQGRSYYALGIGFPSPLLSFGSPEIAASGQGTAVYTDRTRYSLAPLGGQPGESATLVQFVGVADPLAFNLLTPEASLPPASRGLVMSLVVVGTRAADPGAKPPLTAPVIATGIRDAVSPFSFVALCAPDVSPPDTAASAAAELHAQGWIAADAAPVMAALQPGGYKADAAGLITALTGVFPESTQTVAQVTWALSAARVPAAAASAALGVAYAGRMTMQELAAALAGAYPPPSVQELVAQQQAQGATAQASAAALRQANPQFTSAPLPLGVLLRLAFPLTTGTPLLVAQALRAAGYTVQADVTAAVQQLFPTTAAGDVAAAVQQAYAAPPPS